MGGHTIDARYGEAFELFMALLAQVKASECAIPARSDRGDA
jgi:hypothetical protein